MTGWSSRHEGRANGVIWAGRGGFWGAIFLALILPVSTQGLQAEESKDTAAKVLPLKGEEFKVAGRAAFVIPPTPLADDSAIPWVWYAPTLPGLPGPEEKWMFERFQAAGIAIAGIDVGESYGSPDGRALYTAFYEEMVHRRPYSHFPCLLMRSRGGLMLYNWAVEHPRSVVCIAGIYPVCNLISYPGLKQACGAYRFTEEQLAAQIEYHNPIDRLGPLAKARVPIYHIHGDSDTVVPLDMNSGELARRYQKLGGPITLKVVPGQGHTMWEGWFQDQDLVDFVIAHARVSGTSSFYEN